MISIKSLFVSIETFFKKILYKSCHIWRIDSTLVIYLFPSLDQWCKKETRNPEAERAEAKNDQKT